jgi:hypothetical protein
MGNPKKGTAVEGKGLLFSGETKDFEQFRKVMHNNLEEKDLQWMSLAAQAIAKVFQNIVSERTAESASTPMQTDLITFSARKITHYVSQWLIKLINSIQEPALFTKML